MEPEPLGAFFAWNGADKFWSESAPGSRTSGAGAAQKSGGSATLAVPVAEAGGPTGPDQLSWGGGGVRYFLTNSAALVRYRLCCLFYWVKLYENFSPSYCR